MNTPAENLAEKIEQHTATIGVIGMGYVGLPLALAFGERDFPVVGFDTDPKKVEKLRRGENYIKHLAAGSLQLLVEKGRLEATADFDRLAEVDVIVVCVPTPLTTQREPDMTYILSTADQIQKRLRRGQLVILESTTYPGTTDEVLLGMLDESGLVVGEDYFLGFSPEREDPGNLQYSTTTIPKVVAGVDETSGDLCQLLYEQIVQKTVRVSSTRAAEATKLTENIFRAVNIALVNELKIVYDKMGIDVWEVLDAASTKPFGFMRFNPGPGWGGHCIPLDPFYLSWKAREYKIAPKFIELAGEVNIRIPEYVIEKLQEALNREGKAMKGSRILILGLAYKKDIDDPRESPAFEIIDSLLEKEAEISYHDPHVPVAPEMRTWPDLPPMESEDLTPETLRAADAVLIVTDHSAVDYDRVLEEAKLIVDTRGVYREPNRKVVKA